MRDVNEWETYLEKLSKYISFELPLWYKVFMLIDLDESFLINYTSEIDIDRDVSDDDGDGFIAGPLKYAYVFSEYENHEDYNLEWLIENKFVPMFDDNGGGDYFFVDFKDGRILQIYHDEEDEYDVISNNISEFIKNLKVSG